MTKKGLIKWIVFGLSTGIGFGIIPLNLSLAERFVIFGLGLSIFMMLATIECYGWDSDIPTWVKEELWDCDTNGGDLKQ